ncbi:MAG: hypothetical protein ACTSSP_04060 [Candidatus Asgardarchaeia archaeon]
MWDCVLSILVIVHLASEYVHYALEYFWGKKESRVLLDIQRHRQASQKTEMLTKMQVDINSILEKLEKLENGKNK